MLPPKRPLKVPLYPQDVLFFNHIGKTAGMSLISILDSYFPQERIFPLHSKGPHSFYDYSLEELARYRLVRGHFSFAPGDDGVYDHISPKPLMITMLRDPIQRTISAYRHLTRHKEIPPSVTLEDFVTLPEYEKKVYNAQSVSILGGQRALKLASLVPPYPPDVLLQLAKEKLEQIAFFGITERFRDSMRLMTYTFSWSPVREIPEVNRAPEPFDLSTLAPAVLERIVELNEVDQQLYDYACQLFEARYQQMLDELLLQDYSVANGQVLAEQSQARQGTPGSIGMSIGLSPAEVFLLNLHKTHVGQFLLFLRQLRLKYVPPSSQREKLYYKVYNLFLRRRRVRNRI